MEMVVQRKGQDFFRRAVLANYESRCCVTGITETRLLNDRPADAGRIIGEG